MSRTDTSLYLTDEQYLDLLKKIRKDLEGLQEVFADDCTITGMKHTISNVGLCAGVETESGWSKDKYTTRETAMWPEDFDKIDKVKYPYPQQFTMKYRQDKHRCPLDNRKKGGFDGCFYTCMIFKPVKGKTVPTIEEIKVMYDKQIALTEAKIKGGRDAKGNL